MVIKELIGVCGLIVFWNYLLLMSVWKIVFVLVVGNMIVFKFFEVILVIFIKFFEILESVGLLKGVVNFVMGVGDIVGNMFI